MVVDGRMGEGEVREWELYDEGRMSTSRSLPSLDGARSSPLRPATRSTPGGESRLSLPPLVVLARYRRSIRHGRCPRFDLESLAILARSLVLKTVDFTHSISLSFPRISLPLSPSLSRAHACRRGPPSLSRQLSLSPFSLFRHSAEPNFYKLSSPFPRLFFLHVHGFFLSFPHFSAPLSFSPLHFPVRTFPGFPVCMAQRLTFW